jgi:thioesterase domain-containing protein
VIDVGEFLLSLQERGIRCSTNGDKLKCVASQGGLDERERELLRIYKGPIIDHLRLAEAVGKPSDGMVSIRGTGTKTPLFFLSGNRENIFCARGLASHLAPDQPVLFVLPHMFSGSVSSWDVESIANYEVEQILRYRSRGPFLLAGHCAGGYVAFQAARQLRRTGHEVALVAIFDAIFPTTRWPRPSWTGRLHQHIQGVTTGSWSDRAGYVGSYLSNKLRRTIRSPKAETAQDSPMGPADKGPWIEAMRAAIRHYSPGAYPGVLDTFNAKKDGYDTGRWLKVASSVRQHLFDAPVHELRSGPHVAMLAARLQNLLDDAGHRNLR